MSKFRLRFRKTIPIIPKIFFITINKKSISWNFRLGPYSRTWGKGHTISTLDAPGTYGASWRRTSRSGDDHSFSIVMSFLFFLLGAAALIGLTVWFEWSIIACGVGLLIGLMGKWFFGLKTFFMSPFIALGATMIVNWIF